MSRWLLFYRLFLRPIFRDPLRSCLILLSVTLGVAVVLAIEMAGDAAVGSFRSSVATLTGGMDLEVTGVGGIPQKLAGDLARLPYPFALHPRIQDFAVLPKNGETVPILGLDLIGEQPENMTATQTDWKLLSSANLAEGIWVTPHLGVQPGSSLRIQLNDQAHDYTVLGILKSEDRQDDMILMDIALAQRVLRRGDRIDRILIKLPASLSLEAGEKILQAALPASVVLRRENSQSEENQKMLGAFRWNLRILSYIALVVGAFLIYNTVSVSVVRRRPEVGILRALGATQEFILMMFLAEAAAFGFAGGVLGIFVGRALAAGAVKPMGATVSALYVTSTPAPIQITVPIVVLALFLGVAVAVISAAEPAREASHVPPNEAMARGGREYAASVHKTRDLWIASALLVFATGAALAPPVSGKPLFGYLAAVLFIGAATFSIPSLVAGLGVVSYSVLRRILGVEALLAMRSLASSLRRTSVLVGALSTAIAMMTAVGIMVGSFRETVQVWMDAQLKADLYLRPAGEAGADQNPTIDPALAEKLASLPEVAGVDRFRAYPITYGGLPATLGSVDTEGLHHISHTRYLSGRPAEEISQQLGNGDGVIISEPFANKHNLRRGDSVLLPLGNTQIRFPVLDVYYDYTNEKGFVLVDRKILQKYIPDAAPTDIAIYIKPTADLATARSHVQQAIAGRRIFISTNQSLRAEAIRIFDRTFAITYALEIVAILVAVMGIAGALLALVMDRKREFGLLRFLGASVEQIRKLILVEAGLIGVLANIAGILLGIVLSLLLIFVINKQSFGWTIQFHWPVQVLLAALSGVYLATLLAGLYPAKIAMQLKPIEVIHEE